MDEYMENLFPDLENYSFLLEDQPMDPVMGNQQPRKTFLEASWTSEQPLAEGSTRIPLITKELSDHEIDTHVVNGVPEFTIENLVLEALQKPWEFTMITKLLSKEACYMTLLDRISAMWRPKGDFVLIDQEHGYFLVQFSREDDFLKAITEGSWPFFGSYLAVQWWNPEFHPTEGIPKRTVVWVHIPDLPLHLYQATLLRDIGNTIGVHIRTDPHT